MGGPTILTSMVANWDTGLPLMQDRVYHISPFGPRLCWVVN